MSAPQPPPIDTAPKLAPAASPPMSIPSQEVLRGQTAVDIEHNGQRYRLQTTRQGKLILTK